MDFDIALGVAAIFHFEAAQADHLFGQIDDFHRIAHVEHKHIAAFAHGAGLNHELRRFGYGHEVAGDVGVGERYRAADGDLLLKHRHHGAG